jgi:Prenyltransferase and squalene oxidase repeat
MRGECHRVCPPGRVLAVCFFLAGAFAFANAHAQSPPAPVQSAKPRTAPDTARAGLPDALGPEQWARVEHAVDRALAWLASQQQADGSFPSIDTGQPAITSLCVMAFLSRDHQPGIGPYGRQLTRAVDFVLKCQRPDGLFSYAIPESVHVHLGASHTATYNHAISGLMLTELFGSASGEQAARIKTAVEKALQVTHRFQVDPPKRDPADNGGMRYLYYVNRPDTLSDSDLSVTAWHLMFLRSAKNAEFKVRDDYVEAAMAYVERCFNPRTGMFQYGLMSGDQYCSRGMMGAGALSLSLGGKHETDMAHQVGEWLLQHPFTVYGQTFHWSDRFHYSAYYCSQAMAQLGGHYWEAFYPPLVKTFLANQSADGSWESNSEEDVSFGRAYITAMSVLALTPPYQLLPIYQR